MCYDPSLARLNSGDNTNNKEALPSNVTQVEMAGPNKEEMAPLIKRFKKALKGHKDFSNKGNQGGSVPTSNVVRLAIL